MMSEGGNPPAPPEQHQIEGRFIMITAPPVRRRLVGRRPAPLPARAWATRSRTRPGSWNATARRSAGSRPASAASAARSCASCSPSTASPTNSRPSWRCWPTRAARSAGTATTPTSLPGAWQDYLILEARPPRRSPSTRLSGSPPCCRPRPTRGHWPKPTRSWRDDDARDRAVEAVAGPPAGDPRRAASPRCTWSSGRPRCTSRSAARK